MGLISWRGAERSGELIIALEGVGTLPTEAGTPRSRNDVREAAELSCSAHYGKSTRKFGVKRDRREENSQPVRK